MWKGFIWQFSYSPRLHAHTTEKDFYCWIKGGNEDVLWTHVTLDGNKWNHFDMESTFWQGSLLPYLEKDCAAGQGATLLIKSWRNKNEKVTFVQWNLRVGFPLRKWVYIEGSFTLAPSRTLWKAVFGVRKPLSVETDYIGWKGKEYLGGFGNISVSSSKEDVYSWEGIIMPVRESL